MTAFWRGARAPVQITSIPATVNTVSNTAPNDTSRPGLLDNQVGCGGKVALSTRTRLVACPVTASTYTLQATSRPTTTKSQAMTASDCERSTPVSDSVRPGKTHGLDLRFLMGNVRRGHAAIWYS